MKKLCVLVLFFPLLLCSCVGDGIKRDVQSFSTALSQADSLSLNAAITAEYDDSSERFALSVEREDGVYTLEVTEPEAIAGIKASFNGADMSLGYDGFMLPLGSFGKDSVSPVSAVPYILEAAQSSYLSSCRREGSGYAAEFIPDDDTLLTLYFDKDMNPEYAEIAFGGRVRIKCAISGWEIKNTGD